IFIDSDCVAQKNYIQNVIDSMKSKDTVAGEAVSLKSNKVFERSVNLMNDVLQNRILFKKVDTPGKFLNAAESNNFAIRKSVFRKINGFDEKMGKNSILLEDQEFLFRALKKTNKFAYNKRNKVIHKRRDSIRSFIKQYYSRGLGWSYSIIKHRGKYCGKFYIFLSLFYFVLIALLISSFFNVNLFGYFLYIFLLHLISLFMLQILVLYKIKRNVLRNLTPWILLFFTLLIRFLSTTIGIYVGIIKFSHKNRL
ncbi:hypothetical protein KAX75_08115, partial [candidate division WOR-3 bacterium]|nr:hypothetical protein [candidate division WOR-3 bacterium]